MDKMNYTYIVQCSDGTLYTGWTTDVERRVRTHNSGKGAKYTRSRLPVTLVYYETYPTKQEAMRREGEIKQLTREEKERLIVNKEADTISGSADIRPSKARNTTVPGQRSNPVRW